MLREVGRDYAVEISTVDDIIARTPASERMSAAVGAAVGGLAVLLAFIGVHGVLAYAVARKRREIGVRVAVGATPSNVAWAIVREGVAVTAIGVAARRAAGDARRAVADDTDVRDLRARRRDVRRRDAVLPGPRRRRGCAAGQTRGATRSGQGARAE